MLRPAREVILSAGSICTPQILLLSGIGDKEELRKFGIKTVVHLPEVGKNLQDHVFLPNNFAINVRFSPQDIRRNKTLLQELLSQWRDTETGQLATSPITQLGWFRIPDNSSIFEKVDDPAPGPNSPHIQLFTAVNKLLFISCSRPPKSNRSITGKLCLVRRALPSPGILRQHSIKSLHADIPRVRNHKFH
jgi:choline dehydrogenase-like flavoprotein